MEIRLYLLQRVTAVIMVPLVIGHLAVMIYAVQGGLSAGEILERTQGSIAWAVFYGLFVAAVSVHGAIGLRNIVQEWLGLSGVVLTGFAWATFFGLAATGTRAVVSVFTGWTP